MLKALKANPFKSKLSCGCMNKVIQLIMLVWVLGHCYIKENEMAEKLAKHGVSNNFYRPKPN